MINPILNFFQLVAAHLQSLLGIFVGVTLLLVELGRLFREVLQFDFKLSAFHFIILYRRFLLSELCTLLGQQVLEFETCVVQAFQTSFSVVRKSFFLGSRGVGRLCVFGNSLQEVVVLGVEVHIDCVRGVSVGFNSNFLIVNKMIKFFPTKGSSFSLVKTKPHKTDKLTHP